MLGLVGYSIVSLVIGALLTVLVHLFRPIRQNDSFPALKWILGFTALAMVVPYAAVEVLTKSLEKPLSEPALAAVTDLGVTGRLAYQKVTWFDGQTARVIAVIDEPNQWGTGEATVVQIGLERDGQGWAVADGEIVNSFQRQLDATTFPPYW